MWTRNSLVFAALIGLCVANPALADGIINPPGVGQLPGTATNDSAAAGNVGEYVESRIGNTSATVTITIATPAVVTWTTHPYLATCTAGTGPCVQAVFFTTTGALPTGITASTAYYVIPSSITANTFQIATTVANAIAGTAINTSGTQSGIQTGQTGETVATGTGAAVVAAQLTAGDWDVRFNPGCFGGATTVVQALIFAITIAPGSLGTKYKSTSFGTAGLTPFSQNVVTDWVGPIRFSLSATTVLYGNAVSSYTTSTLFCYGGLEARRVR